MKISRSALSVACLLSLGALSLLAPRSAQAQTLVEVTAGTATNTFFPGQSVTTPAGGPFNNIAFNFFSDGPATTPTAAGTLFILTQEYLGTPDALSAATPGFLASSTGISGGVYQFSSAVVLSGNTQYFFYANAAQLLSGQAADIYAGGNVYATNGGGSNYNSLTSQDANFRLSQIAVASAAPEPGSLALLALTGLPLVGAIVRRRKVTA
jgi:hypothetical protein